MKTILAITLIFFITSCNEKKDAAPINIMGVYSLLKQTVSHGSKDSVVDKRQLKIYTDHYMMYASPSPTDSLANYGIATYTFTDGNIVEHIFYTSGGGDKADSATLKVQKTDKGYKQIIEDVADKKTSSTEEYENVGVSAASPLDGVWKQTKRMFVGKKGDTLTDNLQVQFKVYQNGYFIWANTYEDTISHKYPSAFGYGTFQMESNNKSTEININSTYSVSLISKPYVIEIEFPDKGTYKQTHINSTGEKSIEIYQRMQ